MSDVAFHVGKRTSASRALRIIWMGTLAIAPTLSWTAASAQNMQPPTGEKGQEATLSYGGRLYDNHWAVLNLLPPQQPNNRYPADPRTAPKSTWRCVSCHGWDYSGSDGQLGQIGSKFVSIAAAKGWDPDQIARFLRSGPHADIIGPMPDEALHALSLFVCCGQHDIRTLIGPSGEAKGDPLRGKDIYDGVCNRCHQVDGKAPIYGEPGDVSSLGWVARRRAAEAAHKIRNGVPPIWCLFASLILSGSATCLPIFRRSMRRNVAIEEGDEISTVMQVRLTCSNSSPNRSCKLVDGRPNEAIADFNAALVLDPKSASGLNNRGLAFRKKGELDRAIADYSAAITLNPLYALAFNNRGYAYEAKGLKAGAIADFRQALLFDPTLSGAKEGLRRLGVAGDLTAESDVFSQKGKVLAEKNCSWCHAVGSIGDSPNPKAPQFRNMQSRHPLLALRVPLSRGIAALHDQMPLFKLTDSEIDEIVAYINSLKASN